MEIVDKIKKELKKLSSISKAKASSWFFKTGEGQYGSDDKFIGVTVPEQRTIAKKYYKEISLAEIKDLLYSDIHEYRLTGFILLSYKFDRADQNEKEQIYNFYLKHRQRANNWDIVDSSSYIIGKYLLDKKDHSILADLAKSEYLWDNRIAIIATYDFIRNNKFKDTFKISLLLLKHKHDLIHKAIGWMLREIGKRNEKEEEKFLKKYYKKMPRTTLRYAIERFSKEKRKKYLEGKI